MLLAIYIPPDISIAVFSSFVDLDAYQQLQSYPVIFTSDFNCSNFYQPFQQSSDPKSIILNNFLTMYNLQTNFSLNSSGKLLDLVCSSVECNTIKADYPLVLFDKYHPPLLIEGKLESSQKFYTSSFKSLPNPQSDTTLKFNYRKADLPGLYVHLSTID